MRGAYTVPITTTWPGHLTPRRVLLFTGVAQLACAGAIHDRSTSRAVVADHAVGVELAQILRLGLRRPAGGIMFFEVLALVVDGIDAKIWYRVRDLILSRGFGGGR